MTRQDSNGFRFEDLRPDKLLEARYAHRSDQSLIEPEYPAVSFVDFTFPQVQQDLGLSSKELDLFSEVEPIALRDEFVMNVNEGATIALAINTEKAKSEFIIAPTLLELRRQLGGTIGLFSGIEFNVDASKGLNGICDFILTREARQFTLTAPLITVVEAKNDNLSSGLGQCIAEMYAAQLFNKAAGKDEQAIFGVVTTGSAWKFLRLEGLELTLDLKEYYVDNLAKILGILQHIIRTA
jgi:hypothetical protein